MLGILHICHLLTFFKIIIFQKNIFTNTIRVSKSLDPDQAQCFVRPDLGPNGFQRLSADNKENERKQTTKALKRRQSNLVCTFI